MKPLELPKSAPQAAWEIVTAAADAIRARLPGDWSIDIAGEVALPEGRRVDALLRIGAPDETTTAIPVLAKRAIEARDVPALAAVRDLLTGVDDRRFEGTLIASRYLNSNVRRRLVEVGLDYADATGNLHLSLRRPSLFLRDTGAERDPWRGPGRPRDSFRGPIAARVVRTLVDFAPPMTVPQLIERSDVSTGAGYRVVDFLERQGLLERQRRGPITKVDWRPILERWAEDYELNVESDAVRMLEPRGIERVRKKLRGVQGPGRYVLTGSAAAADFEEYAQARMALVYSDSPEELAEQLDLRAVETGANVLLVGPPDDVVFSRAETIDGVQVAAPSQIAVDLLNGPGRAPAEAQALLDWMERNEAAWRR